MAGFPKMAGFQICRSCSWNPVNPIHNGHSGNSVRLVSCIWYGRMDRMISMLPMRVFQHCHRLIYMWRTSCYNGQSLEPSLLEQVCSSYYIHYPVNRRSIPVICRLIPLIHRSSPVTGAGLGRFLEKAGFRIAGAEIRYNLIHRMTAVTASSYYIQSSIGPSLSLYPFQSSSTIQLFVWC